ncbi:MAG: nucleoside permease, partial [Synechococcales cyanobacterium RM1_1_8]|nr:nucleoside permease [Synechococcales cyanobacterium RM1_1_8]
LSCGNLAHGFAYAFFFATVYIFVDEMFPKDVRTSAQSLFNIMILGVGQLVGNWMWGELGDRLTTTTEAVKATDFYTLFLYPTGVAWRPPSSSFSSSIRRASRPPTPTPAPTTADPSRCSATIFHSPAWSTPSGPGACPAPTPTASRRSHGCNCPTSRGPARPAATSTLAPPPAGPAPTNTPTPSTATRTANAATAPSRSRAQERLGHQHRRRLRPAPAVPQLRPRRPAHPPRTAHHPARPADHPQPKTSPPRAARYKGVTGLGAGV